MFWFEQLLPFVVYFMKKAKKMKQLSDLDKDDNGDLQARILGIAKEDISQFFPNDLLELLKEEHKRSSAIDDKTAKLIFSSAFVTAIVVSFFFLSKSPLSLPVSGAMFFSCDYFAAGMLLALGGMRTHRTYGLGADFKLRCRRADGHKNLFFAVSGQTVVNHIKQMRNEAAVMCIRNGVICLAIAFFLRLIFWFADCGV